MDNELLPPDGEKTNFELEPYRNVKDSVFKSLFGDPQSFLSLPQLSELFKVTPHNAARAIGEKIFVLFWATNRRNTLCISRFGN